MLTGRLDHASRTRISGWALDTAQPHQPLALLITTNGTVLDRVIANVHRPDLLRVGLGPGPHGFDFFLPTGLPAHERQIIRVTCERDGTELAGSPALIDPTTSLDEAAASFSTLADATDNVTEITQAMTLLRQALNRQIGRLTPTTDRPAPTRCALVIDSQNPRPHHDAGANAITAHLRALIRLGYEVHFAAADALAEPPTPIHGITHHAATIGSIEELLAHTPIAFDLIYLHRLTIAARYLPLLRHHCPKAHILYNIADLHHLRLAREAAARDLAQLLPRAAALRRTELALAEAADAVITHSTTEADLLRTAVPHANLHQVPWHVPCRPARLQPTSRTAIGFIGHFGHNPNHDAATRLIHDILPALHRANPAIQCLIAGSAMPISIRHHQAPNLTLLPDLSDSENFWLQLRLSVAPMAFGAGVKGKVLDSLAAGIPCLMSPIAAEGLALPPALYDLVVADLADFTGAILALHANPKRLRALSHAGRAYIKTHWSQAAQDQALRAACTPRPPLPKLRQPDTQDRLHPERTHEPHHPHRRERNPIQSR
jgi:glycosyltransferase involved in cell wall biosynthesis